MMFPCEYGLDDQVVDTRPEEVHIDTGFLKVLAEGAKTPLETNIVLL